MDGRSRAQISKFPLANFSSEEAAAPQRQRRPSLIPPPLRDHHSSRSLKMTIDTTEPTASSSAPTMSSLEQTLCSPSPPTPLDAQFRALFTIKSLASSQPESLSQGIDIIGKALSTSESALLKHELAYVLGQMQSSLALPTLTRVLEDVKEHAMVRHEAAEAMGAIGDEAALPILERFKDDEEISVRETVELAVQRIEHERKQKKAGQSIIPTSGEEK